MKKCPQCAEMVQDEAKFCRHCGANLVNRKGQALGIIIIGFAGLAAIAGIASTGDYEKPSSAPLASVHDADLRDAYRKRDAIESQVKQLLKDPGSAIFDHRPNGCGFVNSRNSYGGMSGSQGFILDQITTPHTVWLEEADPRGFKRLWARHCDSPAVIQPGEANMQLLDELVAEDKAKEHKP